MTTSSAPVRAAKARPRSTCWHTSWSPWITSVGTARFRHCSSNRSQSGRSSSWPPRWREDLAGRLHRPADGVLQLLGRVRLDELLAEEELDPTAVVVGDDVAVEQLPSGRVVEVARPTWRPSPTQCGCGVPRYGTPGSIAINATARSRWAVDEVDRPPSGVAVGDDHRLLGGGCVEDGEDVGDVGTAAVVAHRHRPARPSAAPAVERDDPVVPGEVGELRLPDPRVVIGEGGTSRSVTSPGRRPRSGSAPRPGRPSRRRRAPAPSSRHPLGELAEEQVEPHGVAQVRHVARALERHQRRRR